MHFPPRNPHLPVTTLVDGEEGELLRRLWTKDDKVPTVHRSEGAAGLDFETSGVKLTDLASCGGCAAKYSAARLEQLLAGFVPAEAENLLVGLAPADDAAVYRLDDERAIIFTLDFFPPIVDDPGDYGAIAAANALNDVFAMGGTPLLALSIAAFPEELPIEMLAAIFAAADAQVRSAGALLAGGHTIRDDEPKYGLAVVGTVHPEGVWPKNGAQPGDTLFLTKPLGTGLIMTGYKRGITGTQPLERAIRWMKTLNKQAAEVLRPLEPNAVTDVTGFGLFGHAWEVAERSGVCLRLESERFPAIDGALDIARNGVRTSGDPRNRDFAASHVSLAARVPATLDALGYDPQTAGGLLVSIPSERSVSLEAQFQSAGLFVRRIGSVEEGSGVLVA
jgi:selenide,water dikinase